MASSLASYRNTFASRCAVPARRSRCAVVRVQAFQTDSNNGTKQTIDDINKLIGLHIKEAASHLGTMHVWQANAAIGKFVKKAADEAATGKLKVKGVYGGAGSGKK